jgi:multidrug resistance protein
MSTSIGDTSCSDKSPLDIEKRLGNAHAADKSDTSSSCAMQPKDEEVSTCIDDDRPDANLVSWGPGDPENPMNWSATKRWCNLGIISFFRFLTPLASSMIAPVTGSITRDLGVTDAAVGSFVVSIYILGYALGPLLLAPLSEIYGRLPVYHVNSVLFCIWNLASALSPNVGSLLAFRLLAGLAGSCPVTIGNGSIADCVPKERRGRVTAIFTLGPLVGPVFGPLAGGYLGAAAGWRWIFWVLTIVSGVGALISLILQHETYAPVLLERRRARLAKESGNDNLYHMYSDQTNMPKAEIFRRAMVRPILMLFTSPIVMITSIYVGLVYGYTYLLFTSFGRTFESIYGFDERTVGLTFLGFGIGCAIGVFVIGALSDRMVIYFSKGTEWQPEYRLLPLLPGSLIVPIGLLWYGWSAQQHAHWILPIIGTAWVGLGTLAIFMPVQSYLIDAFTLFASSAAAANALFRSLMGAFIPLAGPALYQALGQGWGNTLLAAIALIFTPLAWIAFHHGKYIRLRFPGLAK